MKIKLLLLLFLTSPSLFAENAPQKSAKIVRNTEFVSPTAKDQITGHINSVMKNYHESFSKGDYELFKSAVFPSYIMDMSGNQTGKAAFDELRKIDTQEYSTGKVVIKNNNLAFAQSVAANGISIWIELHRITKNEWRIHKDHHDFDPSFK